jgi:hypothetical protein
MEASRVPVHECLNCLHDFRLDEWPRALVEGTSEAVWPWCSIARHRLDGCPRSKSKKRE